MARPPAGVTADRLRGVTDLPPRLAELAAAHGVATDFWDWQGAYAAVSQDTVVAVLAALGIDASTPEAIEAALEQRRLARWRRMLPPCLVMRPWWANRIYVHVPHGAAVEVWVDLEGGGRRDLPQVEHLVDPVDVDGQLVGEAAFAVPEDLPMGWHQVQARSPDRSDSRCAGDHPGISRRRPTSLADCGGWACSCTRFVPIGRGDSVTRLTSPTWRAGAHASSVPASSS